MTTDIEDRSIGWRKRVTGLILAGFQLDGDEREYYRTQHLERLTDEDVLLIGRAVNDLWNVRGIRSAYLKNAVAAKRGPQAVHTLNIFFTPFREFESPIAVILSLRGLSHYGILSEDGFEIVDVSRVDEALALMEVTHMLNHVDDHDLWVMRSSRTGMFIRDTRLLELVMSRRYPLHLITSTIAARCSGNVDILLPVLDHKPNAIAAGVL